MRDVQAVLDEARALERAGDVRSAEAVLRSAMDAAPDSPWIAWQYAMVADPQDAPEAERRWRAVVSAFPAFAPGFTGFAEFLGRAGRAGEAEAAILRALELAPTNVWALKTHADLARRAGDLPLALRRWRALQGTDPGFWCGYDGELRTLAAMGAWRDLAERLADAAAKLPLSPELQRSREGLLARHGHALRPFVERRPASGALPLPVKPGLAAFPLSRAIEAHEDAVLDGARRGFEALLEGLNRYRADRRLRAYQHGIYTEGRFAADLGFLGAGFGFVGTVFLPGPKAYAWGFANAAHDVWLVTEGLAPGFEITAAYVKANRLLFGKGVAADGTFSGTLASIAAKIDALQSRSPATGARPRALLLAGHVNYAHSLWNEYPALIEIEPEAPAPNVEAVVLAEPFGPLDRIVRFHPSLPVRGGAAQDLAGFTTDLLFSAGSALVTEAAKERVVALVGGDSSRGAERPPRFVVWVSLRLMYRRAVNEAEALFRIFEALHRLGEDIAIALDGYSLPADLEVPGRYDANRDRELARRTAAVAGELAARCARAGLDRLEFRDATSCDLPESVRMAAEADYYLCHHGTQQHKIAWLFDVPGMIHANVEISRKAPGGWAQAQAGALHCPRYVPARFIADAEDGGERGQDPYFRDYAFVRLDELAGFVAGEVAGHIARWKSAPPRPARRLSPASQSVRPG